MPIEFNGVDYVYSKDTPFEKKALSDVNLKIEEGEYISILGKTGSGKSTLVQLMNGVMKPTKGKVVVDGILTDEKSERTFEIRKKVGMVFQYPEHQFFEENVLNEIAFGPKNFGIDDSQIEEKVLKSIEMVELPKSTLFKSPFSLSGGEKRKVAIASVIACDPKYIVFDEPTSGLDPVSVKRFSLLTKKFQSLGKTIVIVTHSVEFALKNSERIIVLSDGKISLYLEKKDFKKVSVLEEIENYNLLLPDIYKIARTLLSLNFSNDTLKNEFLRLKKFLPLNDENEF